MKKYQPPREQFFRLPNNIFDLGLTPIQFVIYAYLVSCAGNKGYCWPSQATISRKTGIGKTSVQEHLGILEKRKIIEKGNINQVISSAMDLAVAQKIILSNPTNACELPKVEHKEMQTVPAEQLSAFLEEAKRSGVYEMYYIELATGLRRGELLGLKWSDIDWKNGIIKVRRQVARVDGQVVEAPLKTKNSYRAVSISPQAIEVLREQKRKTNDTYVFPSPNGDPISPDSVNNMLGRVLERAGIPKVRFHDLRHTFATLALQNGVDIKTVSGILGHFSAGFTLDTYAHVTTSAQKEAAQTMANVLSM